LKRLQENVAVPAAPAPNPPATTPVALTPPSPTASEATPTPSPAVSKSAKKKKYQPQPGKLGARFWSERGSKSKIWFARSKRRKRAIRVRSARFSSLPVQ